MNNEERLTLEESEDERRSLCIEIGQQTSEIWRVQAKLDTCVAALKAAREAISTLDVDALGVATCDYNGAPCQYPIRDELLDNLNKAIAKAEGGHE